jgi:RNA polymerase sigma factor (sigma-70 family)
VTGVPKPTALWQSLSMAIDRQRLMRVARHLLASGADAEDVVQDTYVRALSALPDPTGAEPAWLYTVLRNVVIDRLRRKQMEIERREALPEDSNSMEIMMEVRSECEDALRLLLRRVSPAEAAAILLREVFEFEYHEIASLLGKSAAATRQFIHRARARTQRSRLSEDDDELYVRLCWKAVEVRDPVPLVEMLQLAAPRALLAPVTMRRPGSARSSSTLVQVNGQYTLALVLDGIVLCIVPVGLNSNSATELI